MSKWQLRRSINVMNKKAIIKLHPRKCDDCGRGMTEGYYFSGLVLCSDKCIFKDGYTKEQFEKDVLLDRDTFWTSWEEFDDEAYNDMGEVVEIPPCVSCGDKESSEIGVDTFQCGPCYRKGVKV